MIESSSHLGAVDTAEPARLLKVDEVAKILGRSRSQTYDDCNAGRIRGVVRIGSSVRVHSIVFYRWLEEQAQQDGGAQ